MPDGRDISLRLTTDEINEVLRIFKEIDLNHSGQLSRTEAEDALGQLGVDTFDLLDSDKDGFVDLREWKRFMREVKREKGQQEFTGWCEQLQSLLTDSATRRSNKLEKRKQFRQQMGAADTAPPATKSSTLQQLTHRQTQAGLALFEHIDYDNSQMISFSELKEASLDDKCWRMLDTDLNGDVGLREWLTFLRLTKRDRGSKGLNHWMVDMERNLTGDEGCGVHQALYEAEKVAKGGQAGANAAGKTTLNTGLGMSDVAITKTAAKGQLNQKQRTLALAVFNSVDLDRGGFIEADEIEAVCGREETVMLLRKIQIKEADFGNTHISMHDWMTLMSIKKKESQTSEEFVEWLEELTEKAKVAAEQAKEEAKAAEEQVKRERQRLQSESHEKRDFEAMNLTDAQRTRAMALFAGIDDDGNGTLERHEMERACGEIALVDIDSVFGDDKNNDHRIDMGEWLRWLRSYKQENGNSEFQTLLDTIEKEGNLMRDEEGPPEPEYDDKAQKKLVANMFKYR